MTTATKMQRVFWVKLDDDDLEALDACFANRDHVDHAATAAKSQVDKLLAKVWLGATGNNGLTMMRDEQKLGIAGATIIGCLSWFTLLGVVVSAYWLIDKI